MMIFFFFTMQCLGSTSFINFAYLQVIYNHIDYVSHYFRKIWPLYADDIISILLSFF